MPASTTAHHRHLVSIGQAADYAGVSTKTIRRRVADGSLPAVRLGPRLVRIDIADMDRLLRPIPTAGGAS